MKCARPETLLLITTHHWASSPHATLAIQTWLRRCMGSLGWFVPSNYTCTQNARPQSIWISVLQKQLSNIVKPENPVWTVCWTIFSGSLHSEDWQPRYFLFQHRCLDAVVRFKSRCCWFQTAPPHQAEWWMSLGARPKKKRHLRGLSIFQESSRCSSVFLQKYCGKCWPGLFGAIISFHWTYVPFSALGQLPVFEGFLPSCQYTNATICNFIILVIQHICHVIHWCLLCFVDVHKQISHCAFYLTVLMSSLSGNKNYASTKLWTETTCVRPPLVSNLI